MTRTLPMSVESERALIGAVLQDPRLADDAADVSPEHMGDPRHGHIWRAICELLGHGERVDAITVGERLGAMGKFEAVGGMAYLSKLVAARPEGATAAGRYAAVVRDKATAREIIATLGELLDEGYTEPDTAAFLDSVQARIFRLTVEREAVSARHIKAVLQASIKALQDRADAGKPPGASTGFADLDKLLAGWQAGDLCILGGRSSMGKTALGVSLAIETARAGTPVLVFSVEMGAEQLGDRILCSEGSADSQAFRMGQGLGRETLTRIVTAGQALKSLPVHIDDSSSLTVAQIRSRVRKWASASGRPGLVVVDYLQLVTALREKGRNREQEVADVSRSLKAVARETGSCVLALAQVSRECEKRDNKRPRLSDLRESGSLEQDADVVLFVYRDEYYDTDSKDRGVCEVICAKQRKGPVGTVKLSFDEHTGRIGPLAHRSYE